jgi:2-dehydropantoate 2-reductase
VTLLGRSWHLDEVKRHGLEISGLWGEHRVRNLTVATRPEEVAAQPPFDWIFVTVKAPHTKDAAGLLGTWLSPSTRVCAFQNGLGNYEALRATVPADRLALGRVIFGVEIEPGAVRVTVFADEVLIGSPDPAFPGTQAAALAAALQEAGIPARATTTILVAIWAKVLYNCALNGLSALYEVPYGKLPEHPPAKRLMSTVIDEAYQVAAAHGIRLEPSDAESYRALFYGRLVPDTAGHRSSMLQDLRRGRPTEVDALNGAIVRLGQEKGIAAPANALVTRLVHAKERWVSA